MPSRAALPRLLAVALVVATMALSLCLGAGGGELVGERAPKFTVVDTEGVAHNLTDYGNRVLVIDFFATWCGPCGDQLEELEEARPELDADRVAFLQIDSDDSESEQRVADYRENKGIPWPVAPLGGSVADDYHVDAIPTIVVVDRKGVVRYHHTGVVKADKLVEVVEDLL